MVLALVAAAATTPLPAQHYWRDNFYPYVSYSPADGWAAALHYGRYSPLGFIERPERHRASLSFDVAASTQGSYRVVADAQAPAWWDGWRVGLALIAARDNRLGYYGIGNDTRYSRDSVSSAGAYYYRLSRRRLSARATLQRRVIGPVRLLAGGGVARTDFRALGGGASVFGADLSSGVVDPATIPFTDGVVRAGVVFDNRDSETDPHRGALLEVLFASGHGYTRTTADARVQVRPVSRLVLAGRLASEGMGGTPPLAAQQEMESSDLPFVAVGGYRSLRGFYDGRFTGRGKLLGGVEARYALRAIGDAMELKLVGFYDTGRVFGPGEAVRLTTTGLHRSGGAEVALRLLRNSLLVMGYGRGSEGGQFLFAANWSY
ncbi:MAG TPA: BamA/TamA family outer membrane protein [Gemmatimonadales bacterium]|nr:BamA/TamA family outer membrane protein [Gemmatimonadales bacterium]